MKIYDTIKFNDVNRELSGKSGRIVKIQTNTTMSGSHDMTTVIEQTETFCSVLTDDMRIVRVDPAVFEIIDTATDNAPVTDETDKAPKTARSTRNTSK